jgi:hypothetical protein
MQQSESDNDRRLEFNIRVPSKSCFLKKVDRLIEPMIISFVILLFLILLPEIEKV